MISFLPEVWRRRGSSLQRGEDHPFFALQRDINRMFDDFFRGFDLVPFGREKSFGGFSPSVDVREDEKEVKIKAELPGLEEKDVEVTLGEDVLTIKGEKREDKEEKGEGRWYRESHYGSFSRVIPLPKGLNQEKVDARFRNGVLSITLPRFEVSESKKKKISVKTE